MEFLTAEEIRSQPDRVAAVFPVPLAAAIRQQASPGQAGKQVRAR